MKILFESAIKLLSKYTSSEEKKSIEKEELWKLYQIILEEEKFYVSLYHKQLYLWLGTISAATALNERFVQKIEYTNLIIFIFSILGFFYIDRAYKRYIEIMSTRTKIEVDLKLYKIRNNKGRDWIYQESLLYPENLNIKNEYSSSKEYVSKTKRKGSHYIIKILFSTLAVFNLYLFFKSMGLNLQEICSEELCIISASLSTIIILFWINNKIF